MTTLYLWTYDNSKGNYKKLAKTVHLAQLGQEDLVAHNSYSELMDSVVKANWKYKTVLTKKPATLPLSAQAAGLDFLN